MAENSETENYDASVYVGGGIDFAEGVDMRRVGDATTDMLRELAKAMGRWPALNSAHEGYGVLKEEVDELWEQVKLKQKLRDVGAMRSECLQVAAMALRMAVEVCNEETIRK